jgi:hypothetical protein
MSLAQLSPSLFFIIFLFGVLHWFNNSMLQYPNIFPKDDFIDMQVYASLDLQIYVKLKLSGYALSTIILVNFGC